jgi:hypothetical protein
VSRGDMSSKFQEGLILMTSKSVVFTKSSWKI